MSRCTFAVSLVVSLVLAGFAVGVQAETDEGGLKTPGGGEAVWPRLQARLLTTHMTPLWRQAAVDDSTYGSRLESLSLLGDYYFGRSLRVGDQAIGGFRATSGLILGTPTNRVLSGYGQANNGRGSLGGPSPLAGLAAINEVGVNSGTAPYLGVGYTSMSARGGWGFSADIGLVAQSAGSVVKFGRVFSGAQSLDDMVRDMRLSPLLNVGVSYSF